MKPRLQDYFISRIPLVIRKRKKTVFFQIQYDVAREDGLCAGMYTELSKVDASVSEIEIGKYILNLLEKYHKKADMVPEDVIALTNMKVDEYEEKSSQHFLEYLGAKDFDDVYLNYVSCSIRYKLKTNSYEFGLDWIEKKGKRYYHGGSDSRGHKSVMTFDKPLEFDDNISPEELGNMLFEAFDRCVILTDRASGECYPTKKIDLIDESVLTVEHPRDKHFEDFEDAGVGEIYQLYSYLPSENAESSADFYLGIASEINCNLEPENVKKSWEKYYGVADSFEMKSEKYGIFTHRAEFKNKKIHRISYFLQQNDNLILDCVMDLEQPNRRKKLDEKLSKLFEEFVIKCRF